MECGKWHTTQREKQKGKNKKCERDVHLSSVLNISYALVTWAQCILLLFCTHCYIECIVLILIKCKKKYFNSTHLMWCKCVCVCGLIFRLLSFAFSINRNYPLNRNDGCFVDQIRSKSRFLLSILVCFLTHNILEFVHNIYVYMCIQLFNYTQISLSIPRWNFSMYFSKHVIQQRKH